MVETENAENSDAFMGNLFPFIIVFPIRRMN